MTVELAGYKHSAYSWVACLALEEKGVRHIWREVDPFAQDVPRDYLEVHPFGRVPVLIDDGFVIYESGAITRYVDEAFDGPGLQPAAPKLRARQNQIISIIDAYGYWPLVRQVFSHGFFRPRLGEAGDRGEFDKGLAGSERFLGATGKLLTGAPFLLGPRLSLADIHLLPMLAFFAMAPAGREMLDRHPGLSGWLARMKHRAAVQATWPQLPGAVVG